VLDDDSCIDEDDASSEELDSSTRRLDDDSFSAAEDSRLSDVPETSSPEQASRASDNAPVKNMYLFILTLLF